MEAKPVEATEPAGRGSFGAVLRRYRERALMSQQQLAKRSGLSSRAIRDLETGRTRCPHGSSVQLLADALGLAAHEREAFQAAARAADNGAAASAAASQSAAGEPQAEPDSRRWVAGWLDRPAQLPADVADFTDRQSLAARLCQPLDPDWRPGRGDATGAVPVVVVSGRGGVGKTALVVHVAHHLRSRFPDGQLWVDLGGAGPSPLDPGEVLARFLRGSSVAVPDGLDERSALYRTLLADRRVLVVLDNAADEAQLRPLLPGGGGCGVLVTSRTRLAGLAGVVGVDLEVLAEAGALELLGRIAGAGRVAAELDAAKAIVRACGCLPLAVRIAGARLASRPAWPLARLASRLTDEQRRLDELAAGDLQVRESLALSYQALSHDQRQLLCRLAVLDVPELPAWTAAAALDRELAQVEPLLEALVDAHLLTVSGNQAAAPRYRLDDLVRVFAREQVRANDAEQARTTA